MATAEQTAQRRTGLGEILSTRKVRGGVARAIIYGLLFGLGIIFVLPLIWMVSTSLKPDHELLDWPPRWIPKTIMWSNYINSWGPYNFNIYLRNTVIITAFAGIGQVLSASVVAYGFARLRFPGRDFLFTVVLAIIMLP